MKLLLAALILLSCSSRKPDDRKAEEVIRGFLASRQSEIDKSVMVTITSNDLNNDGDNEIIAYTQGSSVCGSGGCTLFVLGAKGGGYEVISKSTVTRPPVRILESKSNGWQDIAVHVGGGGISAGYEARLRFDGKSYPSNPSLLPPEESGSRSGHIVIDSSSPATSLYN
jgi:hypothetical protein